MKHEKPDPNIPESERHPGAPPNEKRRRIGEDRKAGEEKSKRPVGNSQLPDAPAAFPPHDRAGARRDRAPLQPGAAFLPVRGRLRCRLSMIATAAALLAAALVAADARPPAAAATRPGATAESVLFQCWARESSACKAAGDDDAVEACKTERAKTACAVERAAYEKELAAGLASDAIELLGASIKSVCLAERSAHFDGRLTPDEEAAIATGWREALDVRSEFMRACEKSGRDARECDEKAGAAERSARAEFCPAVGK